MKNNTPEVIKFFDNCLIQNAWSYRGSELFLITDGDLVIRITPDHTYGVANTLSFEIIERDEFEKIKEELNPNERR